MTEESGIYGSSLLSNRYLEKLVTIQWWELISNMVLSSSNLIFGTTEIYSELQYNLLLVSKKSSVQNYSAQ
jgi:hypothetical protein